MSGVRSAGQGSPKHHAIFDLAAIPRFLLPREAIMKHSALARASVVALLGSFGAIACGGVCFPAEYPFGYLSKTEDVDACSSAVENVPRAFNACKSNLGVNLGIATYHKSAQCADVARCEWLMDSVMSLCSNCQRCAAYCSACSRLVDKTQPAYTNYLDFLGRACAENLDGACKKLDKEKLVKTARCTIKKDDQVAKDVAAMTDAQILERWERAVSGKPGASDVAFLHESLREIFSNAQARQNVAFELVDRTYAQLNGEARATLAVSLYTSFVLKKHDPLLVPVIVRVMQRQKYESGEVVILLGELTTQKNERDVYLGIQSQVELLRRPDGGQHLAVRRYEVHQLVGVNRLMFVPYGVRPEFADGITLLADRYNLARVGERMVALGNFMDAETSKAVLKRFEHGQIEAELSGIGRPTLVAFNPKEQTFPEDRCAEWLGSGMYLESL